MASIVKDCYAWGVLGCGWVGAAFAREVTRQGERVWGSARRAESLENVAANGAVPIPHDALGSGHEGPEFPPCRKLLVALPAGIGIGAITEAVSRARSIRTEQVVVISSTSLYPDQPRVFSEEDAVSMPSPHSGVRMLDLERALDASGTTFLRAGGLIGPQRPLFRAGVHRPMDRPLVIIHQDDLVRAILHAADHALMGAFNVVCPVLSTRRDCLGEGRAHPEVGGRRISTHKLLATGFDFLHPDPRTMPDLHPKT